MNGHHGGGHGPDGHRVQQPRQGERESRLLRAHRREPACPVLPDIVVMTARRLIDGGQMGQARLLLNRYLQQLDLTGPTSDQRLVDAARFCAEFLLSCGCDPDRQLLAAQFAHQSTIAFGDLAAQVRTGDLLGRVADAQDRFRQAADTRAYLLEIVRRAGCDREAVVLRLGLAESLHRGGRCGEAIRHGQQLWHDWSHAAQRSRQQGFGIAIGYAQILTGCTLRHEANQLLAQCLDMDAQLATVVEPIVLRSPISDGIGEQHRQVCARNLASPNGPDIHRVATADRTWRSSAGTR